MKTLFALLLMITIAANAFMSWLARDFTLTDGSHFSIMHLELPKNRDSVNQLMASFAPGTQQAVLKQLNADYIFMAGCYPAILVLCLIAIRHLSRINAMQKDLGKAQTGEGWKKLLIVLALLQLLAWGLDVWENAQIESWLHAGVANDNLSFLKARTYTKFGIGFGGFLISALLLLLTLKLPGKLVKEKLTSVEMVEKK